MLVKNSFCTSADSSSWMSPYRYGSYKGKHVSSIKEQQVDEALSVMRKRGDELGVNIKGKKACAMRLIFAKIYLDRFEKALGGQVEK